MNEHTSSRDLDDEAARFEGYERVRRVDAGPWFVRYEAEDVHLARQVSLVALSRGLLASSRYGEALRRQGRLLALLHHEGIPAILGLIERPRLALVLAPRAGWSFREVLHRAPRGVSISEAIALVLPIVEVLAHCHSRGIVLGALGLGGLRVLPSGGVQVEDFFAATLATDSAAASEVASGLVAAEGVALPAPELRRGGEMSARSDVYALGVILDGLIRGFRADRPSSRGPGNSGPTGSDPMPPRPPAPLSRFIARCLDEESEKRYADGLALRDALGGCLQACDAAGEPLDSPGPEVLLGILGRVGLVSLAPHRHAPLLRPRRGRSRRVLWATLGVGLLALLIALSVALLRPTAERPPGPLALLPAQSGWLRVVARPWAYVVVDGERVATTPIAAAIPLASGRHVVRFEHPSAPTVAREVQITAGDTAWLDVDLLVPDAPRPVGPELPDAPLKSGGAALNAP